MLKSFVCVLFLSVLWPATMVAAHGSHDHTIKIRVLNNAVDLMVTVSSDVFISFDTNGDGVVSVREFKDGFDAANAFVDEQVRLVDEKGRLVEPLFRDLPVQGLADLKDTDPLPNVKIRRSYKLDNAAPQMMEFALLGADQHMPMYMVQSKKGRSIGRLKKQAPIIPLS